MKKLFAAFFAFVFFSPMAFAQFGPIQGPLPGPDLLFREYFKKYSKIIRPTIEDNAVEISSQVLQGEYYTIEQIDPEEVSMYEDRYANKEKHATDTYNEVSIHIPEGYKIDKHIGMGYGEADFSYLRDRSIQLFTVNAKEENSAEISFKLDYDIIFDNPEEIDCLTNDFSGKAMTLKIRYSPKYFDFVEVKDNNYSYLMEEEIEYQGKKVSLQTHVPIALRIQTPSGNVTKYFFKPNFENIYKDFKFVRAGYKYAAQDK